VLIKTDLVINGCIVFWGIINALCMSSSSPYCSFSTYCFIWLAGLLFGQLIANYTNSNKLFQFAKWVWLTNILLILYLILFTKGIRGAKRWVHLFGVISYQPCEGLKLACSLLFPKLLFNREYVQCAILYLITTISFILQPDLGSAILINVLAFTILLLLGLKKKLFLIFISIPLLVSFLCATYYPHAQKRFGSFRNKSDSSLKHRQSYQNLRSLSAIRNGGYFGVGPGKGTAKKLLPDSYSDFIFAVICEELGLVGGLLVCLSYLVFILRCAYISSTCLYSKESISIIGISVIISLQAWIHIGSAVWIIPTKGTTLPLISHGGTSTIIVHIALGCLLNLIYANKRARAVL